MLVTCRFIGEDESQSPTFTENRSTLVATGQVLRPGLPCPSSDRIFVTNETLEPRYCRADTTVPAMVGLMGYTAPWSGRGAGALRSGVVLHGGAGRKVGDGGGQPLLVQAPSVHRSGRHHDIGGYWNEVVQGGTSNRAVARQVRSARSPGDSDIGHRGAARDLVPEYETGDVTPGHMGCRGLVSGGAPAEEHSGLVHPECNLATQGYVRHEQPARAEQRQAQCLRRNGTPGSSRTAVRAAEPATVPVVRRSQP